MIYTTSYIDKTARQGHTYWYWVQAISSSGSRSILSTPLVVRTADEIEPDDEFVLYVHQNSGGHVYAHPDLAAYPYGTVIELEAQPYVGYRFSHWEGDVQGTTNPLTFPIHSHVSVRAIFEDDSPDKVGTPVVLPPGGVYYDPPLITFSSATESASFRYTLDGSIPTESHGTAWYANSSFYLAHSAELKVIAYHSESEPSAVTTENYKVYYSLAIDCTGGKGAIVPYPEKEYYEYGDIVVLEVVAEPGYYLNHWAGLNGDEVYNYGEKYAIQIRENSQIKPIFSEFSIQQAINAAGDGDTIIVPPGKYLENLDFLGKDIILQSIDPYDPNVVAATIIDGGGVGPAVKFRNGEPFSTVLTGFTIQNGQGGTRENYHYGGGIYITNGSSPTIENNIIMNNRADYGSGISIHDRSRPRIKDNSIYNNSSGEQASAIYVASAQAFVEDNTIFANSNSTSALHCTDSNVNFFGNTIEGHDGRGIYLESGIYELRNNIIEANKTGLYVDDRDVEVVIANNIIENNYGDHYHGGGINLFRASVAQITGNSLRNNRAGSDSRLYRGGAIYINNSSGLQANIEDNLIEHNIAADGAGIYISSGKGMINIADNEIKNNEAADTTISKGNGGGIYLALNNDTAEMVTIRNNEIEGNLASDGGGLYLINSSRAWLRENAFRGNTARENGGAIYVSRSSEINPDATEVNDFSGNSPNDEIFCEISIFGMDGA